MSRPVKLSEKTELKILASLADYATRPQIFKAVQRIERLTAPRLARILQRLEDSGGYIVKIPKSYPQSFELTSKGRQRLKELQNNVILDDPAIPLNRKPLFSLDNYSMLYPIIKPGVIHTPTEAQMNGWVQKIEVWKDCAIRVNGVSSLSIEPQAMFGEDEARLMLRARAICDRMAVLLQDQFGFVLGVGELNKKPSVEVCTAETLAMYKDIGYVKDYLDASKMRGELVFTGTDEAQICKDARSWLESPKEISAIKKELMYMHEANDLLQGTVVQLIHEVGKLTETMRLLTENSRPRREPKPDITEPTEERPGGYA